jgi:drug/metabolite transporter (DMT)-like permease
MTSTVPTVAGSPGASIASPQNALSGAAPAASGAAMRTGILWMLVATCLFVCQDSTAHILLKAYPATEIAFARFFVHMVLVTIIIGWREPRLMISRRPLLQMLRSSFLLGGTLFGMLGAQNHAAGRFFRHRVGGACPCRRAFGRCSPRKSEPRPMGKHFCPPDGRLVIIGATGMDFSLSMLFPFLAVLASAFYQIATRLLHRTDLPVTTLFYTAIAGTLFCGGFLPFAAIAPGLADAGLMLLLGLLGVVSQFCLIRAFAAAPANIVAPFGYTALVWAALFGLLIFGEIPGPRTLFGVGLIVGAGLFVFLRGPETLVLGGFAAF